MANTIQGLDKLSLRLKFKEYKQLVNYLKININGLKIDEVNTAQGYHNSYILTYKDVQIAFLNIGLEVNVHNSHLSIFNHIFYTQPNLLDEFLTMVDSLNIAEVNKIEIFIDTDSKAVYNKFNRLMRASKLKTVKGYDVASYKRETKQGQYVPNAPKTFYIKSFKENPISIAKQINGCDIDYSFKKTLIRLENKTAELQAKNHKAYIIDYHKKNGLDTSKTIYRLELVLSSLKDLSVSINTIYKSNTNPEKHITDYHKKKLNKQINDIETQNTSTPLFFNGEYSKLIDKNNEFTDKQKHRTKYFIDITRLSDPDYLMVIFCTLSKRILKNVSDIIPTNYFTTDKLEIKAIEMTKQNPKVPTQKEITEYNAIEYISDRLSITRFEAKKNLDLMLDNYDYNKKELSIESNYLDSLFE